MHTEVSVYNGHEESFVSYKQKVNRKWTFMLFYWMSPVSGFRWRLKRHWMSLNE